MAIFLCIHRIGCIGYCLLSGYTMRLDKFLKVSRLIKRRSVAKEASDGAKVKVNGKTAKPACDVKEGDIIEITFGNRTVGVEVVSVAEHALKADASSMYRVIEEKDA